MVVFFQILVSFCFALTPPSLVKVKSRENSKVVLGEDASLALKKWNSKFKLFSIQDYPALVFTLFEDAPGELPMAVTGDFNGDGAADFALMGHDGKYEHIVILLANDKKYDVAVVQTKPFTDPRTQKIYNDYNEEERGLTSYLGLVKSQALKFNNVDKSSRPKIDALELETYGAASRVIYLKKKNTTYEIKDYNGLID